MEFWKHYKIETVGISKVYTPAMTEADWREYQQEKLFEQFKDPEYLRKYNLMAKLNKQPGYEYDATTDSYKPLTTE